MPAEPRIAVIIPVLNEAGSIAGVVGRVPGHLCARILVIDNGSTDATAQRAREAGAEVFVSTRRGYGFACRRGVDAAGDCDALVFLDGDGSMPPEAIPGLIAPILNGHADVVCGARPSTSGLMPWHQRTGNRVIAALLRLHGIRAPELCPYRAISRPLMDRISLPGSRFAWPAEMLTRAARAGARIAVQPVGYTARTAGTSKVSGSLRGSAAASWDIGRTLLLERARRR